MSSPLHHHDHHHHTPSPLASSSASRGQSSGGKRGRRNKVIIIGGGVAGLSLALALKRVTRSTGLAIDPVIFDSNSPSNYNESGPHYILWRWAVEVLLEMGVGARLSKIASPIINFQSVDSDDQDEVLVQWPPKRDLTQKQSTTSIDAEIGQDQNLPPMISTRKCDLLRLLLLAISGARDDIVLGDDYLPAPANNSDLVPDPEEDLDADLAQGRWFENEGFTDLVPELVLGEKLKSYTIDPATGTVTAQFESGRIERGFMLVGADGASSVVRKHLYTPKSSSGNSSKRSSFGPDFFSPSTSEASSPGESTTPSTRHTLTHAGACVIHGITRLHVPPVDTPDLLENGKPIQDLTREDVQDFCPDGRSVAHVGKGLSFTVCHLGNGMVGWNLIVAQPEPNKHAGDFAMRRAQKLLSEQIARNPRQSILTFSSAPAGSIPAGVSSLAGLQTDTRSAEDKWGGGSSLKVETTSEITRSHSPDAMDDDSASAENRKPQPSAPSPIAGSPAARRNMGGLRAQLGRAATSQALSTPTSPSPSSSFFGEGTSTGEANDENAESSNSGPGRASRRARANLNMTDLADSFKSQLAGLSDGPNSATSPSTPTYRAPQAAGGGAALAINRSPRGSTNSPLGSPTARLRSNPKRASLPVTPLPFQAAQPPSFAALGGSLGMLLAGPLQTPLTGFEARELALRLSQNHALPHPCHALIARTDPALTGCVDAEDLAEDPLDTFSIPATGNTPVVTVSDTNDVNGAPAAASATAGSSVLGAVSSLAGLAAQGVSAAAATVSSAVASASSSSKDNATVHTLFGASEDDETSAQHHHPSVILGTGSTTFNPAGGKTNGVGSQQQHNHHVGRVILIGDAAHPIAVTASGSLGAGLAMTDAASLAKLLAKHLASLNCFVDASTPNNNQNGEEEDEEEDDEDPDFDETEISATNLTAEAEALRRTATDLDKDRAGIAKEIIKEARAEGGWGRSESSLVRGLMRLGRWYTPATWTKATYAQMLTRGSVRSGLPSLMPVNDLN